MNIQKKKEDYFNAQYSFNNQCLNIPHNSKLNKLINKPELELSKLQEELIKSRKKSKKKVFISITSIMIVIISFIGEFFFKHNLPSYIGYTNLFFTFIFPISVYECFSNRKKNIIINRIIETIEDEFNYRHLSSEIASSLIINGDKVENKCIDSTILYDTFTNNQINYAQKNNYKKKVKRKFEKRNYNEKNDNNRGRK